MENDDLFASIDLSEILNPLGDEANKAIEALAAASNTPSLSEQEKIWLDFIKLKNSLPQKKQPKALSCFIRNEEISPFLQKKAIQLFAKERASNEHKEYDKELSGIAAAAKTGNKDDILSIAEGLLHEGGHDYRTLFSVFENITTQNNHLTEDFVANPSPYLKLLTGIVQQNPLVNESEQTLETLHKHIQNSTSKEKLKPLFDQTAETVLDIQEQAKIQSIKEYTAWKKERLGLTAHDNNNSRVQTKSQTR